MNIHEYQAKEILAEYGVKIAEGGLAYTVEEAVQRAREIEGNVWVVKAQIHSGARGKAGGIKVCKTHAEVEQAAEALLGKKLVTHQTGPAGKVCTRLYVEAGTQIAKEIYLSFMIDRTSERVIMIGSAQGGMEIEKLAVTNPEAIIKIYVEPAVGLQDFQARKMAFALGIDAAQLNHAVKTIKGCYRALRDLDANILEINPLVVTANNDIIALDAKMVFDENALFRRHKIAELRDNTQVDHREVAAAEAGLSYVGLDGDIGCMINGAGLAMATMDMIKLAGGEPANFLDVGGGATKEQVTAAFKIILGDPNVRGILVNIFGGIMDCNVIAQGIVAAAMETSLSLPLVVRLEGNNVEAGKATLAASGLKITSASDLTDAAQKIVAAVNA